MKRQALHSSAQASSGPLRARRPWLAGGIARGGAGSPPFWRTIVSQVRGRTPLPYKQTLDTQAGWLRHKKIVHSVFGFACFYPASARLHNFAIPHDWVCIQGVPRTPKDGIFRCARLCCSMRFCYLSLCTRSIQKFGSTPVPKSPELITFICWT